MLETIMQLAKSTNDSYINILVVNLTTNDFKILKSRNAFGFADQPNISSLSGYIDSVLKFGVIHMDDAQDFKKNLNIQAMAKFLEVNHDSKNFFALYRVFNGTTYEWCAFEAFAADDYSHINQTAYIIVKRIENYSINNARVAFEALCDDYDSIYIYDAKTDKIQSLRYDDNGYKTFSSYIETEPPYKDLVEKYVSNTVYETDRDYFKRMSNMATVLNNMKNSSTYSFEYQTYINNELRWDKIKFARIAANENISNIVIGITDVTSLKRKQNDFYRDGKTILIVNDNAEDNDSLTNVFKDDYKIIVATSGEEALKIIKMQHNNIAMIVSDATMKIGDNDFIAYVSSSNEYHTIPVIAILERSDSSTINKAINDGALDIIGKPFEASVIKKRVLSIIRFRSASNLLNLIEYDLVTGIYSREFYYRHVEHIIQQNYNKQFAIIVFGIEELRVYNDRNGVEAGNKLLKDFTRYLKNEYSRAHCIGKIRNHLFAVLVSNDMYDDFSYEGIAKTINLKKIDEIPNNVIIDSGIYICDEMVSASLMCDRAELAMEQVFNVYGEYIGTYDDKFKFDLIKKRLMIDNSEEALRRNQFKVYYQPKHLTKNNKIGGAEALVRWEHPSLGFINPAEFIEVFEQNGFVSKIDKYVLNKVCEDLIDIHKKSLPLVPISINLSRRDFDYDALVEDIIEVVDTHRINHSLIHFEITESTYSLNPIKTIKDIKKLHDAGFQIELDDFGTGYSSLSSIVRLDIDYIKFDRSLLLTDDPKSKKNVMNAFAQFSKKAGLKIVQEGVETIEQLKRVKRLGCEYIQGYYYSKPLPKKEFDAYLKKQI